jgi:hypothetical protein
MTPPPNPAPCRDGAWTRETDKGIPARDVTCVASPGKELSGCREQATDARPSIESWALTVLTLLVEHGGDDEDLRGSRRRRAAPGQETWSA